MDSRSKSFTNSIDNRTIYSLDVKDVSAMFGIKYKIHRSGFFQWYGIRTFGAGLDHGYRELYSMKEYPIDMDPIVRYAACVDQIVGRKEMQRLYSTCDLYGVVNVLQNHSSIPATFAFLKNMDTIHDLMPELETYGLKGAKMEKYKKCCSDIEKYLLEQFSRKIEDRIIFEHLTVGGIYSECDYYSKLLNPKHPDKTFEILYDKAEKRANRRVLSYH